MTPETIKWIAGGAASSVVVFGGLIAWLMRLVYQLGASAKSIEEMRADLVGMKTNADKVPILETKAEQISEMLHAHIRKHDSDVKELRRAVWGRSSPDYSNGHGEE